MTTITLTAPTWVVALFAVIFLVGSFVNWRLVYWTRRLHEERAKRSGSR